MVTGEIKQSVAFEGKRSGGRERTSVGNLSERRRGELLGNVNLLDELTSDGGLYLTER
jgi:hypothetical protein